MITILRHREVTTYTHKLVQVRVEIDYDRGTITLLDEKDEAKKWIFANRTLEYMACWQSIFDAMKAAVAHAEGELAAYLAERDALRENRAVDLVQAINKTDSKKKKHVKKTK